MKQEILLYLLETIASTEADDIDGDGFDMVWEGDLGREGWSTESITETAERAAVAIKNLSSAYEFLATEFGKVMYQAGFSESAEAAKQDAMSWLNQRPAVDEEEVADGNND